jgi:cytochrome c-type biogenesis protein CcmH
MRNFKIKLPLLVLAILAGLWMVSIAYAQGEGPIKVTDNDVLRVAKNLYCPVCPNTPLDVCETKACEDWRAQIHDQLSQGWTDQQVIDYFVAQYGERVLAEPQRKGFTSLVWLLPVIMALLGLWVVYEVLKSWRKQKPAPAVVASPPQISDEVLRKIEREIQELD